MKIFCVTNNKFENTTIKCVKDVEIFEDKWSKGIHYVRQQLLDHCRQNNIDKYWMLDDDIQYFVKNIEPGKTEKVALMDFTDVDTANLDIAMINHSAFTRVRKPDQINKSYIIVQTVFVNVASLKGFNYTDYADTFEDMALTLWAVEKGLKLGKLNSFGFKARPSHGKQSNFTIQTKTQWAINFIKYVERSKLSMKDKNKFIDIICAHNKQFEPPKRSFTQAFGKV